MPGAFPYIAVVRRDHDFRIVETSSDFPYRGETKEEGRWLALDWWGNCFIESFSGAVGHVVSKATPDLFLLMLVQPGPMAPDRFVVFLNSSEYRRFGFNPFQAVAEGLFDFTETFYRERDESSFHIDWKLRVQFDQKEDQTASETQRHFARGGQHLARDHSIIIPTQVDGTELQDGFERFVNSLSPEVLRKTSVFSFTNTTSDKLDHFGTLLASVYNPTQSRTLLEVLDGLVPVDDSGSPFKTIRRTESLR
jgi:hypothetical protein